MSDPTKASKTNRQIKLAWRAEPIPESLFASEMHIQVLNDIYYVTFGQVMPPTAIAPEPASTEICAVVRIAVPAHSFEKMLEVFNKVAADVAAKNGRDT